MNQTPSTGTVLLHLYAGALARRRNHETASQEPIHAIYIPVPSPFPQLESFICRAVDDYNLDLFKCSANFTAQTQDSNCLSDNEKSNTDEPAVDQVGFTPAPGPNGGEYMRQALQLYKDRFPNISAILLGTRRTDPHGGRPLVILYPRDLVY
jgi:FAD synthetase